MDPSTSKGRLPNLGHCLSACAPWGPWFIARGGLESMRVHAQSPWGVLLALLCGTAMDAQGINTLVHHSGLTRLRTFGSLLLQPLHPSWLSTWSLGPKDLVPPSMNPRDIKLGLLFRAGAKEACTSATDGRGLPCRPLRGILIPPLLGLRGTTSLLGLG